MSNDSDHGSNTQLGSQCEFLLLSSFFLFHQENGDRTAASVRILKGKSKAIGGPGERAREAVHRSPTAGLLSVLRRPYWSPPLRSFLPTLFLYVRRYLRRVFRDPRSLYNIQSEVRWRLGRLSPRNVEDDKTVSLAVSFIEYEL